MAVGDKVRIPDYNNIRNLVVKILGPGAGNYGYGQPFVSDVVPEGRIVQVSEWEALRNDILTCWRHQTGAATTAALPIAGDTVRYGSTVPNFQYSVFATSLESTRFAIAAGQYSTAVLGTGSKTVSFKTAYSSTVTVNFTSANEARYFFNSGGKIRFNSTFSPSGTSPTQQNNSWKDFLPTVLDCEFGGGSPSVNFYSLTTTPQQFYTKSAITPYAANKFRVAASCNIASNAAGGATQVFFTVTWDDSYTDPVPGGGLPQSMFPPGDSVDGTLGLSVSKVQPGGTRYPDLVPDSFIVAGPSSTSIVM